MNEIVKFLKFCMRRNIKDLYARNEHGEYVQLPFSFSYEKENGSEYSTEFYGLQKTESETWNEGYICKYKGTDIYIGSDNKVIFNFNNKTEVEQFLKNL